MDKPEIDLIDRETVPRLPWHDVHCRVTGDAAVDICRHFIQRWNYSLMKKFRGMQTGYVEDSVFQRAKGSKCFGGVLTE